MLKQITIDNYFQGFNTTQISCIDIPIGGMAGSYLYNNYYYYCFIRAVENNWGIIRYNEFIPEINNILNKLGLSIEKYQIANADELILFIKESVDQSMPILWITDYARLMYSSGYMINYSGNHGTVINGYSSDKSTISIKETVFGDIDSNMLELLGTHPLLTFYLKEYYIKDLWNEINGYYKQIESPYYNVVFRMKKSGNSQVYEFKQLPAILLEYLNNKDHLTEEICGFNPVDKGTYNENYVMMRYKNSLVAVSKCINKYLSEKGKSEDISSFNAVFNDFFSIRAKAINIINKHLLTMKPINEDFKQKIIDEIIFNNLVFKKKIQEFTTNGTDIINVNHALHKSIEVSSSWEFYNYSVNHLLKGLKNSGSSFLGWSSSRDNAYKNHTEWIIIDLEALFKIKEVHIFPSYEKLLPCVGFPIDFTISLSTDKNNWITIIDEKDYPMPENNIVPKYIFNEQLSRYVKIEGTNLHFYKNKYFMQFMDIEVY